MELIYDEAYRYLMLRVPTDKINNLLELKSGENYDKRIKKNRASSRILNQKLSTAKNNIEELCRMQTTRGISF